MVPCSFCGHQNQVGSGFCEKCKTDLTVVATVAPPIAVGEGPITDTLHYDKIPLVQSLGSDATATMDRIRASTVVEKPVAAKPMPKPDAEDTVATEEVLPALEAIPDESKPRLVVLRGERVDMKYSIYRGKNYIGRTDEKPVDIDLENQEPVDRIWTSRQHAIISFENGVLTIEDLNSLNGTFVNRTRVHPGQLRTLQVNDIIQIGTVQMRVLIG